MKKIVNVIIIASLLMTGVWSCNEEKWLTEEVFSTFAPENSYRTAGQMRQALNYLYNELRSAHWEINGDELTTLHMGDIAYGGTDYPDAKFNNIRTYFVPTGGMAGVFWERGYRSIANANVILNRLADCNATVTEKTAFEGEALFFRAFWYNALANVYGAVPVYTDEVTAARDDYVRAPRADVYNQARADLEKTITLLLDVDEVNDGRINKQAAQHLLTEVYISLGNYPKAIETATSIINHPQMALMTTRFGSRASEPGDPYWDLFQHRNQNRKGSGNKESILVFQFEHLNSGSSYGYNFPRQGFPFFNNLRIANIPGAQTVPAGTATGFQPFREFPVSMGGRGIGVIRPTDYFSETVWKVDGTNDYRNAPYTIVRDYRIENNSAGSLVFGEWFVADGHFDRLNFDRKLREWYPFMMKFARTDSELTEDVFRTTGLTLSGFGERLLLYTAMGNPVANSSMKDEYLFRLGGTYLLRAEAYIKNNNPSAALADINALRVRANATPAQLSEINLDYLMDEQMRERYFEDFRMVTLMRMGTFVERMRKCHPRGVNVDDHHNLLPIQNSEIERNKGVKWENNPGY